MSRNSWPFLERFRIVNEINEIDTRQPSEVGDTPLRARLRGSRTSNSLAVTGHCVTYLGLRTKRYASEARMWRRKDMISAKSLVVASERFALGPHLDYPPPTDFSYQQSPVRFLLLHSLPR